MKISSYIKFLYHSKNQHGVHSPFVFDLVTHCLYDENEYQEYEQMKAYRQKLLRNHRQIKITDFGAGSRIFSSEKRKISAMAKNIGISWHRAKLLHRLIKYLGVKSAIELGTALGMATSAMAFGNEIEILTLEGCPETAHIAKQQFRDFNLGNISVKIGEFNELLKPVIENENPVDLIFFDGNHQKEPTINYFNKLLPLAHNDSVFIFDDIHWSTGMEEAWETIKSHQKVTVSIDTFFWGLIFFRREQEKEHFVLRV